MKAPRGTLTSNGEYSEHERELVMGQLERILASATFRNSKRCGSLLRYVVEQTLSGHGPDLKERTLGVEVFHREPDYDTGTDPVVRTTASETRKRIAQYYHEEEHYAEIRIDLSPRSYVPEIALTSAPRPVPVPEIPVEPAPHAKPATRWIPYVVVAFVSAAAMAIGMWLAGSWSALKTQPNTAFDRFWAPVSDSSTVLLCIGQRHFVAANPEVPGAVTAKLLQSGDTPAVAEHLTLAQIYYTGHENVALSDARTLARLAGVFSAKGKDFRILGGSSTTYADLRDHPVVLIGGLNNDWSLRLMGPLRYRIERDGEQFWIHDRDHPAKKDHVLDFSMPALELTVDYALITRVREPSTERMVVMAAGLTGFGTTAAGEFLSDPKYLEGALKAAPEGWDRGNLQMVIATDVIRGNSGPPRVVERHLW